MYRSPIELRIYERVLQEYEKQDAIIMQTVQEIVPDIDKGELIRALEYDRAQYEKGYFEGKEAAEAKRRWIPVTERLPEENGTYIVSAFDGHDGRTSFAKWQNRFKTWYLTGARSYWKVTHWMPLPDPPKGD